MSLKFFLFLFLGILSTFFEEIKAEEICFFSNPEEYEKCFIKDAVKKMPNYPILIKGGGAYKYTLISESSSRGCTWTPNSPMKIIHLGSLTGEELQIKEGFWKRFTNKEIKVSSNYQISGKRIIKWSKEIINCLDLNNEFYSLSYLNQSFQPKTIAFRTGRFGKKKGDLISELLEKASGLKNNENRNELYSKKLISKRIKEVEKRLAIISLYIKNKDQRESDCLNVDETKYPGLVKEYKTLSKEIRPLRKQLNLPINSDLKKICGEPKGSRPLWMEEKIKGCYKYPTQKQRDYCINVYSPYGKE